MPARASPAMRPFGNVEDRRLLLVEPENFLAAVAREIPHSGAMVLCHYQQLTHPLLQRIAPDCIVAPLFSAAFDIFELLGVLIEANYRAILVIIAPPLPNGSMVLRELRCAASQMTVQLVEYEDDELHWTGGRL